ncbi:unnamed protein product [Owenia fusiformis]|uniref:Uncharacterized protein n=1 Tax=Owenia fusiformis TaxID=6347 RepID=A0A8J1U3K7_OWEFU|nr:unnamed protein product [Owenia fusiformis]
MTVINLMLFVLLGLILTTYTSANPTNRRNENLVLYEKPPPKCCTPYLWQANISQVQGLVVNHYPVEIELVGHIWYDGKKEKVAVHANIVTNGVLSVLTVIQDFKAKKQYTMNKKQKTCQVGPVYFPKPERCIPDDAEFLGEEVLGGSLKVQSWKAPFKGETYDVKAYFTMTESCIPVTSTLSGKIDSPQGELDILMTTTTSNYKAGIKDFSIFDIPDYCDKSL